MAITVTATRRYVAAGWTEPATVVVPLATASAQATPPSVTSGAALFPATDLYPATNLYPGG